MKALIFDLEALGNRPSSIILDIAAMVIDLDKEYTFPQLVENTTSTFYRKINVRKGQEGRTTDESTLDWWSHQSADAKKVLRASPEDVLLEQALLDFKSFLQRVGFDIKWDIAYCRGQSYDFPIIADACHNLFNTWGLGYSMFPCAFWNQRDIRTAIAHTLMQPKLRKMPVSNGTFDGFIKHNSIHDTAKDAVLLKIAMKYADGSLDIPTTDFEMI